MKIKLSKKSAVSEGTTVASAIGGAVLSKGTMSLIPADKRSILLTGGVALASILAVASIEGKGTLETALRGVLTGVAVEQGVSTLSEAIKPSIPVVTEESSKKDKFVAAMFGLNGADDGAPFIIPQDVWGNSGSARNHNSGHPFTVDKVASV